MCVALLYTVGHYIDGIEFEFNDIILGLFTKNDSERMSTQTHGI